MKIFLTVLVTFFAGMGAGLGTGFAGMSAAAVITPMLVTFLDIEPYTAVGIALGLMIENSVAFGIAVIATIQLLIFFVTVMNVTEKE